MKAQLKDGAGRTALLWGRPEEILQVMRGMRGRRHKAALRRGDDATDWVGVLADCRSGRAKLVYSVGETLTARHSAFGSIVWRICRVDVDQLLLVAAKPVCSMVFDEGEMPVGRSGKQNPNEYRKYGYNNWQQSAIRQWLNSDAAAGEWWQPQNDWDVEPDCHKLAACFLHGMDKAFLDCVRVSEVTTADAENEGIGYTTSDRFYLPSITEVFGEKNGGVAEGEKLDLGGDFCKGHFWWLRSPYVGNAHREYYVNTSGVLHTTTAYHTNGAVPACVIG